MPRSSHSRNVPSILIVGVFVSGSGVRTRHVPCSLRIRNKAIAHTLVLVEDLPELLLLRFARARSVGPGSLRRSPRLHCHIAVEPIDRLRVSTARVRRAHGAHALYRLVLLGQLQRIGRPAISAVAR